MLIFTVITKSVMAYFFHKKNTPAMKAAAIDSRNDVLTSLLALIGIIGSYFGFNYLDRAAAIITAYSSFIQPIGLG